MGMFDTLIVNCPQCHKEVEFQSKAGECILNTYNIGDVPIEIATDLDGEIETCECGYVVKIKTISMFKLFVE